MTWMVTVDPGAQSSRVALGIADRGPLSVSEVKRLLDRPVRASDRLQCDALRLYDTEEYSLGVRRVSVPVRDHRSCTVAALSASVPTVRFGRTQAARALGLLADGAGRLSAGLGFAGPKTPGLAG